MAATKPPTEWDAEGIKAEIRRQNLTMAEIARRSDLPEHAVRRALKGLSRKGADAIADALGIPFDTLFPTGFIQSRSSLRKPIANAPSESRSKRSVRADDARATA
ncbi:helix-turn-helix domain-containing protein [Aureimonas sp. ME7]|uniref:helix-turn-helix domain-containing protein n=1 Tax=Aureimonas sp. ME7 TaxID=2744252 RepID=UPI0015F7233F|nr:helix-turn-helix domain-containing protein [Aureimonas sp. ME7]